MQIGQLQDQRDQRDVDELLKKAQERLKNHKAQLDLAALLTAARGQGNSALVASVISSMTVLEAAEAQIPIAHAQLASTRALEESSSRVEGLTRTITRLTWAMYGFAGLSLIVSIALLVVALTSRSA